MRWNLAYRTLFHDRGKLIAGLVGVIFSVVLVNIQGGLFVGLISKASMLVDRSHADIWIGHRGMHNVDFAHSIPERWRHVVGKSNGVLSFLVTPYIFTDYDRVLEIMGSDPSRTSYLLAKASPGADLQRICDHIEAALPDVEAMTSDEYASVSINFWMTRTGLGISFGAATLLGLLVGLVMVGQTLYAMVLDRVSEYATLRAIGLSERELLSILILQSALVATIGIAIGMVITVILKTLLSTPRATIEIPNMLYVGCAVLIFCICLFASGLPYLRVRRIDPHTALQS